MVSRSKRIFGMIKKELPGLELCKDMLVVVPTERIVRGFLIETTITKDRVYLWKVVTPLHRPMRHVILNYSDRIFPKSREDIYIRKDAYRESADVIRALVSTHMGYLRSIRQPSDFLRHIEWMMGNGSDHFRFDLALTYFRIGKVRQCEEILQVLHDKVAGTREQEARSRRTKRRIPNPFHDDIERAVLEIRCGPDAFAALLDQWESRNIETLGLQASRLPVVQSLHT